jgi:gamma-glutamyltranspeptidase/glutathione hydrolase
MSDTPTFSTAAVAAPHSLASQSGLNILAAGGNAIEAMIAMAATIAVVYPHMNALGGDAFWLVREPGGRTRAIEACGPAGERATAERYRRKGYDAIPFRGPDAALTVAGAVGGWAGALEYARSLGGRVPLADLLTDATRFAREGYPVSACEARDKPNEPDALRAAPGFADTFLVDGERPKAGDLRRVPALAATLAHLAEAGLDDFYRGDVGREIAHDLEAIDAPVTRADLERYRAVPREPLQAKLARATLYNTAPPTQGLAALLILGIYERLGITGAESVAHHHGLIEATKRAFRIRDRVVTDFDRLRHDPATYLTREVFEREAAAIDMRRAAPYPMAAGDGDTVWMGAIDINGLAVSYIQSIYWEWGSGCVLPRTGIHWQNRGRVLLARPCRREPARARPAAVPHPQSRARLILGRAGPLLRLHGRRRAAPVPGPDLHPLRRFRRGSGQRRRPAALAARPNLGLGLDQPQAGEPLRPEHHRRARPAGPRRRGDWPALRRWARPRRHAGQAQARRPG